MRHYAAMSIAVVCGGCEMTSRPGGPPGPATVYVDPASPGSIAGTGIESQDIVSMTDQMVRDILASKRIASQSVAPQIVIDAACFRNESSNVINKNLFTDRLRVNLLRAADDRLVFVTRENADLLESERTGRPSELSVGEATGRTEQSPRHRYRLCGRIASLDAVQPKTGRRSTFHQVTFELVDLETMELAWSNAYPLKKEAIDDVVYR